MRPGLTTPEVRAGGATVAVTAVAVAVLGLLQQVADLFELKPVINTLIVVAVFFGTLALSVLLLRERPSPANLVGIALAVAAVVLLSMGSD